MTNLQRAASQIAREVMKDANRAASPSVSVAPVLSVRSKDNPSKKQAATKKAPASRVSASGSRHQQDGDSNPRSKIGYDGSPNPSEC